MLEQLSFMRMFPKNQTTSETGGSPLIWQEISIFWPSVKFVVFDEINPSAPSNQKKKNSLYVRFHNIQLNAVIL